MNDSNCVESALNANVMLQKYKNEAVKSKPNEWFKLRWKCVECKCYQKPVEFGSNVSLAEKPVNIVIDEKKNLVKTSINICTVKRPLNKSPVF